MLCRGLRVTIPPWLECNHTLSMAECKPLGQMYRACACGSQFQVSDPGRDFSLLVELEPQSKVPSTLTLQRCVRGTSVKTVVLASFRPPKISAPAQQAHALNKELVLVVDCSGSMGGGFREGGEGGRREEEIRNTKKKGRGRVALR